MINGRHFIPLIAFALMFCACRQKQSARTSQATIPVPTYTTKGKVISQDSIAPPRIIKMKELVGIPSGPPTNSYTYTDADSLLRPFKNKELKAPKIIISGTSTYLMPQSQTLNGIKVKAGLPDKISVSDPTIYNEKNKLIKRYTESQGLRQREIEAMLQDTLGQFWFAGTRTGIFKFDGHYFYYYSEKQGLPNNRLVTMIQDQKNDFWISGYSSLSHFDGQYFTNFKLPATHPNTFNKVTAMVADKKGNIWLGSATGLFRFDPAKNILTHFNESNGLPGNAIRSLSLDSKGNIWAAVSGHGLSIIVMNYTENEPPYTIINYSEEEGLLSNMVNQIFEDDEGHIWISSRNGVDILRNAVEKNYQSLSIDYLTKGNGLPETHLPETGVRGISQDLENHDIYLGVYHVGVMILSKKDGRYSSSIIETLEDVDKSQIFRDRQNQMWEYGGWGINRLTENPFRVFEEDRLGLGQVFKVAKYAEDKWGRMWFGSYGNGLFLYTPESNGEPAIFHRFTQDNGMSSSYVDDLVVDGEGDLWMGTRNQGLIKMELSENEISGVFTNYLTRDSFPVNTVPNLMLDQSGDLWCALYGNGSPKLGGICRIRDNEILHIGTDQGLVHEESWSLQQDAFGHFWIGSVSHGLTKFQFTSDSTKGLATHFNREHHLLGHSIYYLVYDQKDNLWAGHKYGDGLVQINLNEDNSNYEVKQFSESEGLLSHTIRSMFEDHSGDLWIGSDEGLSHMERTDDNKFSRFTNYTALDGFSRFGCFDNGLHQGSDGTIWVGTNEDLVYFKPSDIKLDSSKPAILLNEVYLFNEKMNWAKDTTILLKNGIEIADVRFDSLLRWSNVPGELSLRHDNNFVSFDFTGVSVNTPHRVLYSYYLDGWDKHWSVESKNNTAIFGKLDPGKYTFKVKVRHEGSDWSTPLNYSFSIRPPWWKSAFAYLIYTILGLIALYAFIRWRIRMSLWEIKLLEGIRTNISADLHDDVGTILSGVAMQAEYLAEAKPDDIEAEMNQISDLSREAMEKMRDIVWALDSRKDKLENLVDRMHSFTQGMLEHSKFEYQFNVSGIIGDKFISPDVRRNVYLIYKEAINNIIKHSDGDQINISFVKMNDRFNLSIYDNGRNKKGLKTDGLGLSNMEMRAEKVGGLIHIRKKDGFTIDLEFG